ncbi:putative cholinesterase [Cladorrhinum sp. PSN259]|nr:putative cholinesterase [Cladorrhinum sp. PSN259]
MQKQIIAEQAPQHQLPFAKNSPHSSAEVVEVDLENNPQTATQSGAGEAMLLNRHGSRQPPSTPWRNHHNHHRVRITSWIYGLAVLLLVWLYVYIYGFGYLRATSTSSSANRPPLQVSVPGYDLEPQHPGGLGNGDKGDDDDDTNINHLALPTKTFPASASSSFSSSRRPPVLIDIVTTFATPTAPISRTMANKTKKPAGQGAAASGPLATAPAAAITQGTYVGVTVQSSKRFPKAFEAFRGVPYAQDTSGQNRFRPPQRLPPSTKTMNAAKWGQACPTDGVVRPGMGENCLNLNVYRPAGLVGKNGYLKNTVKKAKLPVIVYVHGGGFNAGKGTERNMASFVSWAEDPIVSVNFNYRVGALGFLPSDVTAKAGLLNLGLRDQQMALEWVKENIEVFGGDPDNITIMGLSAGAHSIGHHIMHYAQSGKPAPFHKAILESGATTARAVLYPTHQRHLLQFRQFLAAAGADHVPDEEVIDHLRTLPLATIVTASNTIWNRNVVNVTWPFQPVIDGSNPYAKPSQSHHTYSSGSNSTGQHPIIPDLPINSWLTNKHLRIPIITGYNTNEGAIFIPPNAKTNQEFREFFKGLIPTLREDDFLELEKLYPDPVKYPSQSPYVKVPPGKGAQWARLDAAYSHYAYICPVLQTAHYMSGSGVSDVYVYRYAATSTWNASNHGDEAGIVAHDMELIGYSRGQRPGLMAISNAMHGAWARFVTSKIGSPNSSVPGVRREEVKWPQFESPFAKDSSGGGKYRDVLGRKGKIMVFGEGNNERDKLAKITGRGVPAKVEGLSELEVKACEFWWGRVWLSEGVGKRGAAAVSERAKI